MSTIFMVKINVATATPMQLNREIGILEPLKIELPPIGAAIQIRVESMAINGIVIGYDTKDGRSIVDYEGPCLLSNGQMSKPTRRWAWIDQILPREVV